MPITYDWCLHRCLASSVEHFWRLDWTIYPMIVFSVFCWDMAERLRCGSGQRKVRSGKELKIYLVFFFFWKAIVYFYSSVCLLCQHQGRIGVPCPPLVLPGQVQWAPCCLYASLVVASVPSAALEFLFLFLSVLLVPILWGAFLWYIPILFKNKPDIPGLFAWICF